MVQPTTPSTNPIDPSSVFAELSRVVLGDEPLGTVLERVAGLAVKAMPEASEVSVTLMEGGRARTVAFTGSLAVQLDERQYETGWGPCLDAAVSGHTITVDTADPTSTSYPDFAATAQRAGVVQSVSVGLPVADRVVGALNTYCRSEAMSESSVELAEASAGYAAVALANAARYASTAERAENMAAAMRSRAVIEQAKGIIIATRHCGPDEAFAVLVKASQRRNMKLRDVAAAIVAASQGPAQDRGLPH